MISFIPERGHILLCDFDMATVPPEMRKVRRVVVMSPRSYNRAGRCVVVPFSATPSRQPNMAHVSFEAGSYRSLSVPVWAICDAITHVSFARLDRVNVGGRFMAETMTLEHLALIEVATKHALGMV